MGDIVILLSVAFAIEYSRLCIAFANLIIGMVMDRGVDWSNKKRWRFDDRVIGMEC
jgi:hypothetical protein